MEQWAVWIIDSEHWPRVCFRAELLERGLDAGGYEDLTQVLAALGDKYTTKPDLIILELRGLSFTPAELHTLVHYRIPLIALGGAEEWDDKGISDFPWVAQFHRPFSIGEVCDTVEKLLA